MVAINGVFGIFLVLFAGAHVCLSMTVDIPEKQYKVARGDNVTIPCKFTLPSANAPTIKWSALSDVPDQAQINVVTRFSTGKMTIGSKYKGRVNLDYETSKGIANLQLLGTTSADTRTFECEVQSEDDEEGSQSDTTRLVVLVAPSVPVCQVEGVAEYGQNINLTCRSEEGTPTPTYKWQSHDVNNIPRLNPPKTTDQNGILSLYNISKDTSGFYICTSTNEIRSAKCNLTLAVMQPSMNMASTFGIIGAIAVLALILGIVIFCCCCRKKEKNEEYVMGTPEGGEYTDKDPKGIADSRDEHVNYEEEHRVTSEDRRDPQDDRSERSHDRRSDYDDRRDRSDDRRDRSDDRRDRYDDRRDRYDDRRDRYDDQSDHYNDRRKDNSDSRVKYERDDRYDDRRDRYDDQRGRYDDSRGRYDDRRDRYDSDRYSDRYDSHDRPPSVPPNKPKDQRN